MAWCNRTQSGTHNNCYQKTQICGTDQHTHTSDCLDGAKCGKREHTHTPACWTLSGPLCGGN